MPGSSSTTRPTISHPYPPSYRSHLSPPTNSSHPLPPSHTPNQQFPPSSSYTYSSHTYPQTQSPSHSLSTSPNPNLSTTYPQTRPRSSSSSSLAPVLPKDAEQGLRPDGLPLGWTKEDEEAEKEFLRKGMFDWGEMRSWRFWIRKEWWLYYLALIVLGVMVILMSLYHDDIVKWLRPVANWMKNLPAGWTIPIAVLFVISFPPLFGHEIVAVLVGAVWGLWIGFGIVSAGTFFGEVGNFFAFKYWCRARAIRYERDNMNYACMAHVVREGGFFIIFVARLSAIPGHFTTAVFATCGMNIFIFSLACLLTMPKQLLVVYLGVLFDAGEKSTKDKIISNTVLVVGFLLTVLSAWYIYRKMNQARVIVWRKQRMALAAKGISIDPVTGQKRTSFRQDAALLGLPKEEDVDLTSPMLNHHQSYQNPYEIRYQPTDNMSVYDVDAEHTRRSNDPLNTQNGGYTDYGYNATPPSTTFPDPHPLSPPTDLHRGPTSASSISQTQRPIEAIQLAEFPVPNPMRAVQDDQGSNWRGGGYEGRL